MAETLARWILDRTNRLLRMAKIEVATANQMNELREYQQRIIADDDTAALPPGAEDVLYPENPRLVDLKQRYRQVELPMIDHSKWTQDMVDSSIDLRCFRKDNAYIYQQQDFNTQTALLISAFYQHSLDSLGLFQRLDEDSLFGPQTAPFLAGTTISRDLLDSIAEILFLEEHLQLSAKDNFQILDIGAGYGRFAHRMTTAFPDSVRVCCVDAIAESTFLSEYYLDFRGVGDRATVVPLDELASMLADTKVDLATNIHSFSECTMRTITGWLDIVREHEIPYFFIVPNAEIDEGRPLVSVERDFKRLDYLPELQARGYRRIAMRPKFADPFLQQYGVSPTHYHLFELQG